MSELKRTRWKPWFAWYPVRTEYTHFWVFFRRIYRRSCTVLFTRYGHYEYGTEFDVLISP